MRRKIERETSRLKTIRIQLGSRLWRARLYEAGNVISAEYNVSALPDEQTLIADLHEGLHLYRMLRIQGGAAAEDSMLLDAKADLLADVTIEQAKRYRQHKHIERDAGHARLVKKLLGTRCMGCTVEMAEVYGPVAEGLIHAHHLAPLSSLALDQMVKLDPKKDFAVLCPNCHAVIHRMDDVSDLPGLRALVSTVTPDRF